MSVNPDFANAATVTFADPPKGSCITQQFLQELQQLIRIQIPTSTGTSKVCSSGQANNLFTLDAENCGYVSAGERFTDQQDWIQAAPADIVFSGWPASLDATSAILTIDPLYDPADFGVGFVSVVSRTADRVTVRVSAATHDVSIQLDLYQPPIAPQTSS